MLSQGLETKMEANREIFQHFLSRDPDNYNKYVVQDPKQVFPHFRSYFARFLPSDKAARIVDIGCGCGAFVLWLEHRGYTNVAGIDISREQVEAGKAHGVKSIHCADAFEYLALEDEFALIAAHDLIEHFSKEQVLEFLTLAKKALQPGGILLLSVPNGQSLLSGRIVYGDFTHQTPFTPSSLAQVLWFKGFSDVKVYPKEPVIHGMRSLCRWILWKIFKQFIRFYLLVEIGSPGDGVYTEVMYAVAHKPAEEPSGEPTLVSRA